MNEVIEPPSTPESGDIVEKVTVYDEYGNKRTFVGTFIGRDDDAVFWATDDGRLVTEIESVGLEVAETQRAIEFTISNLIKNDRGEIASAITHALDLDVEIPL